MFCSSHFPCAQKVFSSLAQETHLSVHRQKYKRYIPERPFQEFLLQGTWTPLLDLENNYFYIYFKLE